MKLIVHRNLRDVQVIEATRVVIEDALGNPIAVGVDCGDRAILFETLTPGREAEFHALLRQLGVNKVVVATDLNLKTIEELRMS